MPPLASEPSGGDLTEAAAPGKRRKWLLPGLAAFVVLVLAVGVFVVVRKNATGNMVRLAFDSTAEAAATPLHAPLRSSEPKELWAPYEPSSVVNTDDVDGDTLILVQQDKKTSLLTAVNLVDGKQLWEEELEVPFSGSVAIMGKTVLLVGSDTTNGSKSEGIVIAYDIGSHKKLWSKALDGSNANPIGEANGRLWVRSGDGKSTDIYSFEPGSAEQRFKKSFDSPSVFLGSSLIYVLDDETVRAFDQGSNDEKWHFTAAKTGVMAEVGSFLLFAPTEDKADAGQVVAYDLGEGHKQWSASVKNDAITRLGQLDADTALVEVGDRLVGISMGDKGSQKFTTRSLSGARILPSGLVIGISSDSSTSDRSDKIVVFDPARGEAQQTINTKQAVSSFDVADGMAYTYDSSANRFIGYDTASGEKIWTYNPKDETDKPKTTSKGLEALDGGVLIITNKGIVRLGN